MKVQRLSHCGMDCGKCERWRRSTERISGSKLLQALDRGMRFAGKKDQIAGRRLDSGISKLESEHPRS
jgi:hypothetical protein